MERKHKGTHGLKRCVDLLGLDDGIDSVGARGDPSNEQRREEQERALCVSPCCVVDFVVASSVRVLLPSHSRLLGGLRDNRSNGLDLVAGGRSTGRDMHRVVGIRIGMWAEVCRIRGHSIRCRHGHLGGPEGGDDVDGGKAFGGVKVVELLVLLIDCSSGSDVDEKGGKDDNPGLALIY